MSEMKNFDDHLKRSFGGYSPAVSPHIWENIVAGRKKRRPAAFWLNKKNILSLAALLIVLTGGALLLSKKQDAKIISHENDVTSRQQGTEIRVPAAVGKTNTSTAGNNPSGTAESISNLPNRSISSGANINTDHVAGAIPASKNEGGKGSNPGRIDQHLVKQKSKGKFTMQSNAADLANLNEATDEKGDHPEQMQPAFLTSRLFFNAEKLTAASLADLNGKKTDFKPIQIPCPEKDAAGNKQYWEVYAGPDYAFKKYNDTANSALLEKRKASTSFQSAFSAGIRFTRVFSNGMSFRGGLNFSQIKEKFSYAQSNVVQLTYEINQAGDTINSFFVRGTKYKTSYNHYRTLDVPLLVGYEIGNGRLHANINAGAVINIYSWQNGETLDTAFAPVSFSSGKSNDPYQYKTNVGIGFLGGVSVYYKLNDRLHLLAEPYYRYNFSPMNKETLSIQEKFSTIGLRLGLRIDL